MLFYTITDRQLQDGTHDGKPRCFKEHERFDHISPRCHRSSMFEHPQISGWTSPDSSASKTSLLMLKGLQLVTHINYKYSPRMACKHAPEKLQQQQPQVKTSVANKTSRKTDIWICSGASDAEMLSQKQVISVEKKIIRRFVRCYLSVRVFLQRGSILTAYCRGAPPSKQSLECTKPLRTEQQNRLDVQASFLVSLSLKAKHKSLYM